MTNTQRIVARQLGQAKSWATSTMIRIMNAESALRAAILRGDGCEIAEARRNLEYVQRVYDQAGEDVDGWRRLSRTIR